MPGIYPATAWVFCRFPQFCLRFCPRPALRLRETREFPEWSTKHPLFSLEISGNAKCWGPSVFLFVCRKSIYRPTGAARRQILYTAYRGGARCRAQAEPTAHRSDLNIRQHCRSLGRARAVVASPSGRKGCLQWCSTVTPPAARRVRLGPPLVCVYLLRVKTASTHG